MLNVNLVRVIGHISVPYMTSNMDTDNEGAPPYQQSIAQTSITGLNKILPKLSNTNTFNATGNEQLLDVGKILIVDDEKFNCDIIEGFLMILGFNHRETMTEFAYNGEQAVKKVKDSIDMEDPYRYSLILMDCNMPFLDGYEATKRIRKLYLAADIQRD